MNKVVVIGSLNVDVTSTIERLPKQGETMSVKSQASNFGGKGANQAVAASRQGADLTFIGAVGADERGEAFKQLLNDEGIKTDYIYTKKQPTGSATILLEADGHNTILVHGGANMELTVADVEAARSVLEAADIVVAQLEVPRDAVAAGFKIAKSAGAMTILNPAPVTDHLDTAITDYTDLIVPNETEAAALAGTEPTTEIAELENGVVKLLKKKGLVNVIITLGGDGVYYNVNSESGTLSIFKVNAIDTTAAGDTFIGTVAANITANMDNLAEIIRRSSKASSIAVSRAGAIVSIPTKEEVDASLAAEK